MESTADGGGQPDMIWVPSVSVRQKPSCPSCSNSTKPSLDQNRFSPQGILAPHPISFHQALPDGHNLQFSFATVVK